MQAAVVAVEKALRYKDPGKNNLNASRFQEAFLFVRFIVQQ